MYYKRNVRCLIMDAVGWLIMDAMVWVGIQTQHWKKILSVKAVSSIRLYNWKSCCK